MQCPWVNSYQCFRRVFCLLTEGPSNFLVQEVQKNVLHPENGHSNLIWIFTVIYLTTRRHTPKYVNIGTSQRQLYSAQTDYELCPTTDFLRQQFRSLWCSSMKRDYVNGRLRTVFKLWAQTLPLRDQDYAKIPCSEQQNEHSACHRGHLSI